MLKTVDELCDFIVDWCQEDRGHVGQPLDIDYAIPDCIVRLNARVGDLWRSARPEPGPVLQYATPFLGLLAGQDQVVNPSDYCCDKNGVVPFIVENQGVWRYGFDRNDIRQLLVSGDWCDGLQSDQTEWRRVAAAPEDALVCTLLINLCMQSDANWDDSLPKPEATNNVLWRHPAWSGFDGFWIDDTRSMIYFSGWQVTRRQHP